MNLPREFLVALAFGVVLNCQAGSSSDPFHVVSDTVTSRTRAAVVQVSVTRSTPNHVAIGTGFFVSHDGLALTDWHVIRDAATITVQTTSGRSFAAIVLVQDREHDLAILRVAGDVFPTLQLSDTDNPQAGLGIALIGAGALPCQHGHTGAMRKLVGRLMRQISIPLVPGSSGSPLIDAQGRVVGIVNGQYVGPTPAQDENYAVPAAAIRRLLVQHALLLTENRIQ